MINQVYKLIAPNLIRAYFEDRGLQGNGVLVRPTKLSICAADQRYYTGKRGKEAMRKKLPMSLIHEAVGVVVHDPNGEFNPGDKVVMIPNTPMEESKDIAENYLRTSKFRASGYDGFMQDYVFMRRDRVIKYTDIKDDIASFVELISVAVHAISRFDLRSIARKDHIGVWGDGSLGFITALILKKVYKDSKVYVFGKNEDKLEYFSFVDGVYIIDKVPEGVKINHAFEAVGGRGCSSAVNQIISLLDPEGSIALLGVSEDLVDINTRDVLEKGLTLIGSSRSGRADFIRAINILEGDEKIQNELLKLVSDVIDVNELSDINKAFERDLTTPFKTVMNWNI